MNTLGVLSDFVQIIRIMRGGLRQSRAGLEDTERPRLNDGLALLQLLRHLDNAVEHGTPITRRLLRLGFPDGFRARLQRLDNLAGLLGGLISLVQAAPNEMAYVWNTPS